MYSIPVFNPLRTQNQTFFANLPSHLQQRLSTITNIFRTWSLSRSGLSSEALDYSTPRTTEHGKPEEICKNPLCRSVARIRHSRFQRIDEQESHIAARLIKDFLEAGRAGDIDLRDAVTDHIYPGQ